MRLNEKPSLASSADPAPVLEPFLDVCRSTAPLDKAIQLRNSCEVVADTSVKLQTRLSMVALLDDLSPLLLLILVLDASVQFDLFLVVLLKVKGASMVAVLAE